MDPPTRASATFDIRRAARCCLIVVLSLPADSRDQPGVRADSSVQSEIRRAVVGTEAARGLRRNSNTVGSRDWKIGSIPIPPSLSSRHVLSAASPCPSVPSTISGRLLFAAAPAIQLAAPGYKYLPIISRHTGQYHTSVRYAVPPPASLIHPDASSSTSKENLARRFSARDTCRGARERALLRGSPKFKLRGGTEAWFYGYWEMLQSCSPSPLFLFFLTIVVHLQ